MQISKIAATAIVNIPDIAMERYRGADVIAYGSPPKPVVKDLIRRRSHTTAPFSARRKASSPVIASDYSFKNAAAAFSTPSFGPMAASAGGAAKQIFAAAMTSSIVTFAIEESTCSADLTSPVIR